MAEATALALNEEEALCELRHVDKEFPQGKGPPLRVLEDVSISVRRNEVVALLGPSGCGKSTILRILAGLTEPTGGQVMYHSAPLSGLNPGIGFVFQSFALYPWMTVSQNVEAVLRAKGLGPEEVAERAGRAIRTVGLGGFEEAYPRELSGGQQQRVALARALAIRPEVLLLDEPLSALDAGLRAGMLAELARLHRELPEVSILYVTHDQIEALTLADRIAVLRDARLVDCGTPERLDRRPADAFTASFVGRANLLPVTAGQEADRVVLGAATDGTGAVELRITAQDGFPAGSPALLCVRPHQLRPATEGGPNLLRGRVSDVQWLGSTHRVQVDLDAGPRVAAELSGLRVPPAAGEELALGFDPEDGVLLPAEGAS
jgi:2-aminoethylphosphonate transport system ATP-binding protein